MSCHVSRVTCQYHVFSVNVIHGSEVSQSSLCPLKSDAWTTMGEDVSQWMKTEIHSDQEEDDEDDDALEDSEEEWHRIF